jgi:FAD/FMN-containing dehydrogenase
MVATNAGGSRVVRFGTMGAQVRGIQAVTAGGGVIGSLAGLPKATLGPSLPSILVGSEGILAIVTAVRLQLVPHYGETATALLPVRRLDNLAPVLASLRQLDSLDSVELLLPSALDLTQAHLGIDIGVSGDAEAYVLVECASHTDPMEDLAAAVADLDEVGEPLVASGPAARARLRDVRERTAEAIHGRGVPLKLDVAVPVAAIADACRSIEAIVLGDVPDAELYLFGHLAEGNLHVNIVGAGSAAAAVTERVLGYVAGVGGAISAEHGIGVAKARWLHLVRNSTELALLRALKHAWDPQGVLNPGVLC